MTGTHVYGLFRCPRAVALDIHEDPDRRRPLRPDEEFVFERGRAHEARIVERLGWPEPAYPARDFEAGALATRAMLADGVEGVCQGVLLDERRLGIPDLLRREPGRSGFGDWHYVVGDIKSSARPRSDQLMQVLFYSSLLAELQGRAPEYAYLVLKDGHEERFRVADYAKVLAEVEATVDRLREDPARARPFLSSACGSCRWSDACLAELEAASDLSLLPGMTRGLRATLESVGVRTCEALASVGVERVARDARLEPALLRRLGRAAAAQAAGRPLPERRSRQRPLGPVAFVHFLTDAFEDRVLFMGVLRPGATPDAEFTFACPRDRTSEWSAFEALVGALPPDVRLLHYGPSVPRWYEREAHGRSASVALESRLVDLARHLRGAAVYPGPVFGLAEQVRLGLGRDPHRAGRAGGAALFGGASGSGAAWLRDKGRSDLEDLAALRDAWLSEPTSPE